MPVNCDPACQKIIINSGFVAILAALLAEMVEPDHPLFEPASSLAKVAEGGAAAFKFASESGALVKTEASGWNGCSQAERLTVWIRAIDDGDKAFGPAQISAAAAAMDLWRKTIIGQVAAIVRQQ